jgi:hypothetical protein
MQQPEQNGPNLFVDALICGSIGAGVAYAFGRPLLLWAMLCTLVGPVFILFASHVVRSLPPNLPGRESGTWEFAAFALLVAIAVAINPFSG